MIERQRELGPSGGVINRRRLEIELFTWLVLQACCIGDSP